MMASVESVIIKSTCANAFLSFIEDMRVPNNASVFYVQQNPHSRVQWNRKHIKGTFAHAFPFFIENMPAPNNASAIMYNRIYQIMPAS